jgi:hypothetical protein
VNLADVSYFLQGRNSFPHDWKFLGPVLDLFNSNGVGIASINNALVIPNWDSYPTLVKHAPIFLNKGSSLELNRMVLMGQVKLHEKMLSMSKDALYKELCWKMKLWVDYV